MHLSGALQAFVLTLPMLISGQSGNFAQVTEALTARTSTQQMKVAYRLFTAPTFPNLCAVA